MKEEVVVVWFKRDLRLHDNEALANALDTNKKTLLFYVFEPLLLQDAHYSERHWNFIKQSLESINEYLKIYNTKVLTIESELIAAFNHIQDFYTIKKVFSHQETGLLTTYNRDKEFARYCRNNVIQWHESINNGVLRGLLTREDWFEKWEVYMNKPLRNFNPNSDQFISLADIEKVQENTILPDLETKKSKSFQIGGTLYAQKYLDSFLQSRHKSYMYNISKPEASRESCSRLSPYISWGNLSIRQVYKQAKKQKEITHKKRNIAAFISRLRWQAHFIQKFEMEHTMENASVNKGYHKLKKPISEKYQQAWQDGETGFPLVDASMRCLHATGYVNFRMRAMLVSFLTHILWQPWQAASEHLSRLFLDFEPGIHFPQLQMQAGETGINNLRIYNPIKNSLEHDHDAVFIKKWVPELSKLPIPFIHEPYLMTKMEQQLYNFRLGVDYPNPIVNIKENRKKASDILWNMKTDKLVIKENQRILNKHTLKDRFKMLKDE